MVLAQVCVTRSVGYSRSSLPVLPIILFIYSFTLLSRGLIWLNTIFELFFFTYVIWALLSTHPMVFAHSSTQTDQVCQSKTSSLNGYKEKGACEHMKYPSFPLRHVLSYLFVCVCFFSPYLLKYSVYTFFSSQKSISPCLTVAKLSKSGRNERSGICEHSRLPKKCTECSTKSVRF